MRAQPPAVAVSSADSHAIAYSRSLPHITGSGRRLAQTAGRRESPKIAQRLSAVSCTHLTPAGLPLGMPGIGELIDGAMQQAPQPIRQARALT